MNHVIRCSLVLTALLMCCAGEVSSQQITGGPATVQNSPPDNGSRTMNIYTISAGGGATGDVHPSTSIPTFFGSIGQPFATVFSPSASYDAPTGAGVFIGAFYASEAGTVAATAPTAQPTNLTFSSFTATSYSVSFTAAVPAPAGYLVLRKAGSPVTDNPIVGNTYALNATLGSSTVVSVGTGLTFSQTGLTPGTIYYYAAFSYNGAGGTTNYLITNPLTGNSLSAPPAAQPTAITLSSPTTTGVTIAFTPDAGADGVIVLRKDGAIPASLPTNATTYTAGSTIGDAYVSYLGNGSSFSETGLTAGTVYNYEFLSYKGAGIGTNYLTTIPLTGTSLDVEPSAQPTGLIFSSVTQSSFNVSFTGASGADGYVVVRKVGSAPVSAPADATGYTQGATLGDGVVAYVGASTIFSETSLATGTDHYYAVYAYKGSGITTNYIVSAPLSGNQSTLVAEPTSQPTFLTFTNIGTTTVTVSYTAASPAPSGYIAIRRANTAPTSAPVDGTAYAIDDAVGNGSVAYVGSATTFDDTNLSSGTNYFYAVYAYNGSATSSNFLTSGPATGTFKTNTPDATPPVISTNNTPLTVDPGTDLVIKVVVTEDASTVASVSVDYRSVSGAAAFTTQALTMTNGTDTNGTWEFTVPKAEIGDLGVEYKITATNSVPLSSTVTSGKTAILFKTGFSFEDSDLPPGTDQTKYRIVAFPFVLSPNTVGGIFNALGAMKETWRVFHYSPPGPATEWKESNILSPGVGYWVLRKNSTTIAILNNGADGPVQGTTVGATLAQPFTVNLAAGWNQIGNPYLFNVLWNDVLTASGLDATTKLRTYNGNFADGDRLKKFEGGFVNVSSATTLTFPVIKNPAAGRISKEPVQRKRNSIDQPDWDVNITLRNGDIMNVFGGVGMNTRAAEGYDAYDDIGLPRFLDFVEINHGKDFLKSPFTLDVEPSQQNYTWDFTIESSLGGVTDMTWDNSYFGKNDKWLVLVDVESSELIDMRQAVSYSFTSGLSHKFKVVYGSKEYVMEHALPNELVIARVFPNPAGGPVKVGFTLPNVDASVPVQVKLINMRGQAVTHIFDGNLAPGYHELTWNGLDDQNLRPAQGLYFVQVQGGKFTVQQRLVLK